MSGVILPLPQNAFIAWCSVKAQGQFYLTLLLETCNKYDVFERKRRLHGSDMTTPIRRISHCNATCVYPSVRLPIQIQTKIL